jgi:formate dehydrogenase iron-sulfur subunit
MEAALESRRIESFYHLPSNQDLSGNCRGLACFVARHQNLLRWHAAAAQSQSIFCLGKCYAGPATCDLDQRPLVHVLARRAVVLDQIAEGGARTIAEYVDGGGYRALAKALDLPPEELVDKIRKSGLRGRGGAGYSTGEKWRSVLGQGHKPKFVVANGDEGDPGAYVDRFIMEENPHSVLEALLIAGYAVGANQGYIYVRREYPLASCALRRAISEARRGGYLGQDIFGTRFSYDIELVLGKGSYICGEETALLNSIEDKRPEVRLRPPYPTECGLFGQPTLVQNIETLANIPWIVRNGCDAYRELGSSTSRGTKVVSLNSLFCRPGLYEIEFGLPVRVIVEDIGGGLKTGKIAGVIIGGPLAGVIHPDLFDTPFGFEELCAVGASVGHGGIVAFDEHTSIPELVHHIFEFGSFESCGKCTPCRLGSSSIAHQFANILGRVPGSSLDRAELQDIVAALRDASACGLGTGLGEFAQCVLRYYAKDLEPCFM